MTQANTDSKAASPTPFSNPLPRKQTQILCRFHLNMPQPVLATHRELGLLRDCSRWLTNKPARQVHIVGQRQGRQIDFIRTTLLHFGVSCAQIKVKACEPGKATGAGIWLLVA